MIDKETKAEPQVPHLDTNELATLLHIEEKVRAHPTLKALHETVMRALHIHSDQAAAELVEIKKDEEALKAAEVARVAAEKAALEAKARQDAADLEAKTKAEQEARDKAALKDLPPPAADTGQPVRRID